MKTYVIAALALLLLAALPTSQASTCEVTCVDEVSVGRDGATVRYHSDSGFGSGAYLHAGPDGVTYDRYSGITNCHTHVGGENLYENWCYF